MKFKSIFDPLLGIYCIKIIHKKYSLQKNVHYYIMYNNEKLKQSEKKVPSREMDKYISGIIIIQSTLKKEMWNVYYNKLYTISYIKFTNIFTYHKNMHIWETLIETEICDENKTQFSLKYFLQWQFENKKIHIEFNMFFHKKPKRRGTGECSSAAECCVCDVLAQYPPKPK